MQEINLIGGVNKLSYGRVTINLLIQLRKLGVKVNLLPIGNLEFESKEKEDIYWGLENSKTTETTVPSVKVWHAHNCSFPEVLTGPHYQMPIFELDTFTEQEKSELSKVQIINCTKWAEEVCHKNGLTNTVGIVNLGYDPGIFYPKERPKNDLFTVLNVGKIEIRKTHDLIPDIFSTAFSKADQVSLIMSWGNPFYSEDETNSWHRYYDKKLSGYNVSFIGRTNNQEQLANIMRSADVGLFPARAEGWNLDMLEMMACGKPCVTTNYSGHTEFINNINSLSIKPVEFELAIDGKWFFGAGEWMKITNETIKELARLLQLYYKNWKENSLQNISSTVENFTWKNSAKQLLSCINR